MKRASKPNGAPAPAPAFGAQLDALVERLADKMVAQIEQRVLDRVAERLGADVAPPPEPRAELPPASPERIARVVEKRKARAAAAKHGGANRQQGRKRSDRTLKIIELLKAGKSRSEVAARTGDNVKNVSQVARKYKNEIGDVATDEEDSPVHAESAIASPTPHRPPTPPVALASADVGTFSADDEWGAILTTAPAPIVAAPLPEPAPIVDTSTARIVCQRCGRPGHGPIGCLADERPAPPPPGRAAPAIPARPDPLLTVLETLGDKYADPRVRRRELDAELGYTPCRDPRCTNEELHEPGRACRGFRRAGIPAYRGTAYLRERNAARRADVVVGGGSPAMTTSTPSKIAATSVPKSPSAGEPMSTRWPWLSSARSPSASPAPPPEPGAEGGMIDHVDIVPVDRLRASRPRPRRSQPRKRTIGVKRMRAAIRQEQLFAGDQVDALDGVARPRTRGDCLPGGINGERPCPFVSCKYHPYLDVNPETGSLILNFPHLDVDQLVETCALDVADRGGETLENVGAIQNLTRERIRQSEMRALHYLKTVGAMAELAELDDAADQDAGATRAA